MSEELSRSEEALMLSHVPLFINLDSTELEDLAELVDQVEVKAGDIIFHEHDKGDALYIVETGSVRIWVRDEDAQEVTLSELKPGDFFGELAVLDSGERSANASAIVDSTLHRLSRDDFHDFLLKYPHAALDVIREIAARLRATNLLVSQRVTRNINQEMDATLTFGQRIADKVAAFGGSWTFIFIFGGILFAWMVTNSLILARIGNQNKPKPEVAVTSTQNAQSAPEPDTGLQWDPYPYILLNLVLSTLAALQAPVIMMSQNRAAEKDRLAAEQDFKVNLKSEYMLEELVRRDRERTRQIDELLGQIQGLQTSVAKKDGKSPSGSAA